MRNLFIFIGTLLLLLPSCKDASLKTSNLPSPTFSIDQVQSRIVERGKTWDKALKMKDSNLLKDLYDTNSHYLPNDASAFHGNEAIVEFWESSFSVMKDLFLTMETLEGTKELLYETGKGTVKIMNAKGNFDSFPFKYINIWKLQPDGRYKIVIDSFNNFGR